MDMTKCWHFEGEFVLHPYFALHVVNVIVVRSSAFNPVSFPHILAIHYSTSTDTWQKWELPTRVPGLTGSTWIFILALKSRERCKLMLKFWRVCVCVCVCACSIYIYIYVCVCVRACLICVCVCVYKQQTLENFLPQICFVSPELKNIYRLRCSKQSTFTINFEHWQQNKFGALLQCVEVFCRMPCIKESTLSGRHGFLLDCYFQHVICT